MKTTLIFLFLIANCTAFAQRTLDRSASAEGVSTIVMDFTYPEVIKVKTWDKNEVKITGKVMINNGTNDDAFKLNVTKAGNYLKVSSTIENLDDLPHKIMIKKGDESYYFDTDDYNDPKIQAFLKENEGDYNYQMHGVIKEITLEVTVPKTASLEISSKFGLIEIAGVSAPLIATSKHGGVDVSLSASPREITARTKFGELFSNMDMEVDRSASEYSTHYKWTKVVAKINGGGAKCDLESKFGNVYIRKE